MASADFAHLHVHTEYSMLDGASRLDDLFAEAKRIGQTSVAMTDHGYMFGAYDFWRTARQYDIKPIIGVEAYVTPGTSRFDRTRVRWGEESQRSDDVSGSGAYTHMTLLAENTAGMHNLFRMSSLASLEGQLGKWPRMDRDLLQRYATGVIGTSGCASGEVQVKLRLGQYDQARQAAGELQEILGKENFFIEIMDHGADIERRTISELLQIAKEIDAPLLATNDSHYTRAEDAHSHEALLCVQSASTLMEPTYDQGGKRFAFSGGGYYLKSAAEMREIFVDHPEACDNTVLVAERCNVEFDEEVGKYMPHFPAPEGQDEVSTFVQEVNGGLDRRYQGDVPENVSAQARYEIDVITSKGYAGYYLVVADFINWAKRNGIRVGPGRGSGAGSMAAYAMGITDLDPIQHGLIFERFLNPERMSLPDFDIDFDERRRGEVINYVSEKYGEEQVAYIVTYGTIKAKQALKDSARVLGYEFAMGERLSKALPAAVMGKEVSLGGTHDPEDKRYAEAGEFRELIGSDPDAARVFDTAKGLENLKRQWGVHAAGVIIASDPLIDVIPIMRRPQDGAVITQIDFPAGEDLGLVKMDFLGLRNLTVLEDALENIRLNGKDAVDIDAVPLDDPATYALLSSGETLGVFQLDGGGMRTLLRQMRPDNFEDISAVGALYRPGPMGANSHTNYALRKNGLQDISSLHPGLAGPLDDILGTTYGLIVYQEQVMEIAQKLAGYTLGQADLLRRAMGKKKKEVLDAEYVPFSEGMRSNGYTDEAIQALWDVLVPFSDYAFNKAHSAAYGVVSYWTAYLKANYPVEYMAALLTSTGVDKDKSALYLNECRHMRITVLPPDVNDSVGMFTAVGHDIRFGLASVRNVGANVVAGIVAAREEHGRYTSFSDFLEKVPAQVCNKRTIESLIKAGAFDSLGATRRALLMIYEQAIDAIVGVKRKEAEGQFDLFASLDSAEEDASFAVDVPDLPEWEKKQKLAFEREMLGLYVSDHPLAGIDHVLEQSADCSVSTLNEDETRAEGSTVAVAGLITSVTRKTSKAGRPFAIVSLEDMTGGVEIMFFGETYLAYSTVLAEDTVVIVKGRIRRRDDELTLHAVDVTVPDVVVGDAPVTVTVPSMRCNQPMVEELRSVLSTHPGGSEVHLKLTSPGRATVMRLDDGLRVDRNAALYGELKALLGPACLS